MAEGCNEKLDWEFIQVDFMAGPNAPRSAGIFGTLPPVTPKRRRWREAAPRAEAFFRAVRAVRPPEPAGVRIGVGYVDGRGESK